MALGPADGPAASNHVFIFLLLFSAPEPLGNAADPTSFNVSWGAPLIFLSYFSPLQFVFVETVVILSQL